MTRPDELFDLVARDMTAGEPAADFRARVIAALPAAPHRTWPRFVMPAGAIVTLALLWLTTDRPVSNVPPDATISTSSAGPASAGAIADADPALTGSSRALNATAAARAPRKAAMSAEELAWRARAVPHLPAVTPLAIDAIQPAQLSIAPITVEPIVTEPLALGAIDVRSGGRQ